MFSLVNVTFPSFIVIALTDKRIVDTPGNKKLF